MITDLIIMIEVLICMIFALILREHFLRFNVIR